MKNVEAKPIKRSDALLRAVLIRRVQELGKKTRPNRKTTNKRRSSNRPRMTI